MKQISTVQPEYWIGKVDEEIIQDAQAAGLSDEGIQAMIGGDRNAYKAEIDKLERANPGSIWACTAGYSLWFNAAAEGERVVDYNKINEELEIRAEAIRAKERDKYRQLLKAGIPTPLARMARAWSAKRIKEELGVEIEPHGS